MKKTKTKREKKRASVVTKTMITSETGSFTQDIRPFPDNTVYLEALPPVLIPVVRWQHGTKESPRYDAQLNVVLFCKGASFKSKTINVSVTGMLIEDAIPIRFVNQLLDIVIFEKEDRVEDTFLLKGFGTDAPFRSKGVEFTQSSTNKNQKYLDFLKTLRKIDDL